MVIVSILRANESWKKLHNPNFIEPKKWLIFTCAWDKVVGRQASGHDSPDGMCEWLRISKAL